MFALDLPDTDGAIRSLPAPGEAPATLVVWTCNHCPYALAWHDRLAALARDYAERGVPAFFVNSNDAERYPADGPQAMRERAASEGWSVPYLWDESQERARQWGAEVTPHAFVLDRDLELAYAGAPDADHREPGLDADWLRGALDAVLAGEPVDPARTDAVGCSIKWRA